MTDQQKAFIEYCVEGDLRGIKTCVKYGVNIHVQDSWCIDIVARKGYSKIVKYFLENGISHEVASRKKVLAYSCGNLEIELVKYLIENSDEHKKDNWALEWAAAKGNLEIFELLMVYFEEYNHVFVNAASTGQIEILQFLIDHEIDKLDISVDRALNRAAKNRKWNAVDLLLENEIVDIKNLAEDYSVDYFERKKKHKTYNN